MARGADDPLTRQAVRREMTAMTTDSAADATTVTDNAAAARYELAIDGQIVFARYRRDGATVAIRHVEAPPALRGTGAASALMDGIMAIARRDGFSVTPLCSYASWWLERHPEHHDLVA